MIARVEPLGPRTRSGTAEAVLSGLLLAVTFLPLPQPAPLLVFVALVPLWRGLSRTEVPRRGAEIGAAFGLTFWVLHLAWLPLVSLRIGESWPWMAWCAQVALLSLFSAAVGGGFVLLRDRGMPVPVAAAIAWVGVEWARGHLLGPLSFPWSGIALPLARIPVLVQPAAWGGESFLAAGVVVTSAALAEHGGRREGRPDEPHRGGAWVLPLVLVSLWVGLGFIRLGIHGDRVQTRARGVVVQPARPLAEKRGAGAEEGAMASLRSGLADAGGLIRAGSGRLVIFPETHLPFVFDGERTVPDTEVRGRPETSAVGPLDRLAPWPPALTTEIGEWAARHDAAVLVGAYRRDAGGVRNAVLHLGPEGLIGFYDKVALVPGVERGPGGLVPGGEPHPLDVEGRAGVLVCIESAWGTLGRRQARAGAGWLLNVTNDAWLGEESGGAGMTTPAFHQHPWHLILRSVETGRGAVRVANNGLTGTVDPLGRWLRALPPHRAGVAAVTVGSLGADPLFVRTGDWLGPLALLLLLLAPVVRRPAAPR